MLITLFEIKQHSSVFITAGRHSYMIGVHIMDNPYKTPYHRGLWEHGYRFAKKQFEPPRYNYPKKRRPVGN